MHPDHQRYTRALAGHRLPAAFVDLDAFDANVDHARAALGARPLRLRVGSKSLRCVALLQRARDRLGDRFGGLLCYAAPEAQHLAAAGFDDLLVAYPTLEAADAEALARVNAGGVRCVAMADDPAHLEGLARAARAHGTTIPVAVDLDMAWRPRLGGTIAALTLGVFRSPLRSPGAVVALARRIADTGGLSFAGVMGYEAQVAGLRDRDASGRRIAAHALVKWLSRDHVRQARAAVVEALHRAGLAPPLVNGGGTGSLAFTRDDPSVTEAVVGSGFVGPHLFDGLDEFASRPALFFALRVSRRPAPGVVTCFGGGYVASGAAGADRLPRVHFPRGATLMPREGAGEVQTPLRLPRGTELALGDTVVLRHAKGGELAERFDRYHLLRGDAVCDSVPTYRGDGAAWG